jgi:hypothetical protein
MEEAVMQYGISFTAFEYVETTILLKMLDNVHAPHFHTRIY